MDAFAVRDSVLGDYTFGLEEREGRFVRRRPLRLRQAADHLAGVPAGQGPRHSEVEAR